MLTIYIGYVREIVRHSQLFCLDDFGTGLKLPNGPNHACPLCVRSLRSFLISGNVLFDIVLLLLCKYILNMFALQAASELIRRAKQAAKDPESKRLLEASSRRLLEASPFHQGNKRGGKISPTIVPEV